MADGKALRFQILRHLKEAEHARPGPTRLEDMAQELDVSEEDVGDQLDILDDLGAIDANRTLGGSAVPMLKGRGKMLLEEMEQELRGEPSTSEVSNSAEPSPDFEWDAFIAHASEDKDAFVQPLAVALSKDFRIWYDAFTLTVGDSLRRAIDKGLKNSRFGIVVLSKHFFQKEWPQKELDGLTAKERRGSKVILPVWLDVEYEDVANYSLLLADRVAAKAKDGLPTVVRQLSEVLRDGERDDESGREQQLPWSGTEQTDDAIWAALASAMEAGKGPVVDAGMMKITVLGVVQELVVDAAMLVEALRDRPMSKAEIRAMSGGVYEHLEMAIPDAERQGLVMEEPFASGERIMLTHKGRLLARILEEDRLRGSRPSREFTSEAIPERPSARAPSQISVTPAETTEGGKVDIVPLGWLPAGDLESLRCSVQGPDGTVWTKDIHQDLRMGLHGKLVFPDDFDDASTKEQGVYIVRADRISGDGDVTEWGPEAVFQISGGPAAS